MSSLVGVPAVADRIAVVTGAARGGGRGVAQALASLSRVVVLVGRSTAASPNQLLAGTIDETAEAVRASGGRAHCVGTDLSDIAGCQAVVAEVLRSFGRCDILINNAAYNPVGKFVEGKAGKWAAAVGVNLNAAAVLSMGLLPGMLDRGYGRIINIGSAAAVTDFFPQLAYAVSKAGLERFTTGLATELRGSGVSCNCVRVDEALLSEALTALSSPYLQAPMSGYTAEQFGQCITWLADQPADFTGRVLTFAELRSLGGIGPSTRL